MVKLNKLIELNGKIDTLGEIMEDLIAERDIVFGELRAEEEKKEAEERAELIASIERGEAEAKEMEENIDKIAEEIGEMLKFLGMLEEGGLVVSK